VLSSLKEYPQYSLSITENEVQSDGGKNPVQIELSIACAVVEEEGESLVSKTKKQKGRSFQMTAVLTLTSDNDLIDLRRIP
jgi:ATP-dependent DNA helicase HFM1/MER3